MKIFNFFKKLNKKKETIKKEMPFFDFKSKIEEEIHKIEKKEGEIFFLIKEKISDLSKNLKLRISEVENIDLNQKKAEDKLKAITEEGRKNYLELVENLMNKLDGLKEDKLENTISDINIIFSDFKKRSNLSYERATVLIGKEMAEIKNTLIKFSNEIIKIFNENKHLIESSKVNYSIKSEINYFKDILEKIKKTEYKIDFLNKEISANKKKIKQIINEIKNIMKSPKYIKLQKEKEELKNIKEELEKEIFNLRQSIDFKSLGKFYHVFEEKMRIVKSHRDNFFTNFNRDNGGSILQLLKEAKFDDEEISKKIIQIKIKKEKISTLNMRIKNNKILEKLSNIYLEKKERLLRIEDLKNKQLKEKKRLDLFNKNREEIFDRINRKTERLNIKLQNP